MGHGRKNFVIDFPRLSLSRQKSTKRKRLHSNCSTLDSLSQNSLSFRKAMWRLPHKPGENQYAQLLECHCQLDPI